MLSSNNNTAAAAQLAEPEHSTTHGNVSSDDTLFYIPGARIWFTSLPVQYIIPSRTLWVLRSRGNQVHQVPIQAVCAANKVLSPSKSPIVIATDSKVPETKDT